MASTQRTFRDWLADTLDREQVSRRELARRLAQNNLSDAESNRRSIRRILNGEVTPTQPTRDAIQDALDDHSAPSSVDEERDETDALQALARDPEILEALMPVVRLLRAKAQTT